MRVMEMITDIKEQQTYNPQMLREMRILRLYGWAPVDIAERFGTSVEMVYRQTLPRADVEEMVDVLRREDLPS